MNLAGIMRQVVRCAFEPHFGAGFCPKKLPEQRQSPQNLQRYGLVVCGKKGQPKRVPWAGPAGVLESWTGASVTAHPEALYIKRKLSSARKREHARQEER